MFFDDWISKGQENIPDETDGYPFWSLFDNVASWWKFKDLPNVKFVHYVDLVNDLSGSIREIAAFLDLPIDESTFPEFVDSCMFVNMKKTLLDEKPSDAPRMVVPLNGIAFHGGATAFLHSGTTGKWKNVLSKEQLDKYEEVVSKKLTKECADWLEYGKIVPCK
jgi:aryl sulfotransferase